MIDAAVLENFEWAFSSGMAGCVRQCRCGREFYDTSAGYDWEPGEIEALEKRGAAPLDYSVGTIYLDDVEFCVDCDCWHKRAEAVVRFIAQHQHGIAEFLTLERKRKFAEAEASPVVK